MLRQSLNEGKDVVMKGKERESAVSKRGGVDSVEVEGWEEGRGKVFG